MARVNLGGAPVVPLQMLHPNGKERAGAIIARSRGPEQLLADSDSLTIESARPILVPPPSAWNFF